MSDRLDLDLMVDGITAYAEELGILLPGDKVVFRPGMPFGFTFTLRVVRNGESGESSFAGIPNHGNLGDTAKEAETTLCAVEAVLDATVNALRATLPPSLVAKEEDKRPNWMF